MKVASLLASTASCIVIPAPSAEAEVSPEPLFRVIFLSSTSRVAVLSVVVVPLTVRLPVIVVLPVTVALPATESDVPLINSSLSDLVLLIYYLHQLSLS